MRPGSSGAGTSVGIGVGVAATSVGGAVGAVARWSLTDLFPAAAGHFPGSPSPSTSSVPDCWRPCPCWPSLEAARGSGCCSAPGCWAGSPPCRPRRSRRSSCSTGRHRPRPGLLPRHAVRFPAGGAARGPADHRAAAAGLRARGGRRVTGLLVALGAAVGAPLRYLAGHWLDRRLHWGTLLVNLVGSAMLGALVGAAVEGHWLALLGTGFCGGLTTYSAFAVQTVRGGTATRLGVRRDDRHRLPRRGCPGAPRCQHPDLGGAGSPRSAARRDARTLAAFSSVNVAPPCLPRRPGPTHAPDPARFARDEQVGQHPLGCVQECWVHRSTTREGSVAQRRPVTAASFLLRNTRLVPVMPATPTVLPDPPVGIPLDVLVIDGRVVEVGENLPRPPRANEHDADGRWLIPGLWDQHVHLDQWTQVSQRLDLTGTRSVEEVLDRVVARLAEGPEGPVLGMGASLRRVDPAAHRQRARRSHRRSHRDPDQRRRSQRMAQQHGPGLAAAVGTGHRRVGAGVVPGLHPPRLARR